MENPWPALWAIVLGFFMLLVDTSILTVATPAIMVDLDAGVNEVIWVTSAYLLAYVVPLLICGRLGDRFGPKRVYLVGLVLFTVSSLLCATATSIGALIAFRALQGLGAAAVSPQTMAIITRIFPRERRGQAMALWGAAAGLATLTGPLLGGVLVDHLGWEWIFFVNIPVGVVGFVLALKLVPDLSTHPHRFDVLGVALFGVGMLALILGIQEAGENGWGPAIGSITVWQLILVGLVVLAAFVLWQARNRNEPLMPLELFRDRNFSTSNVAIATVSFAFTSMGFPLMLYAQAVRGWSPTESGLLMAPLALASMLLAGVVGKATDRVHPKWITAVGFGFATAAMTSLCLILTPDVAVWKAIVVLAVMGCGAACLWGPLSATANRNLPMHQAGAGAGVYNTTRQIGAVLGSAVAALLLDARLRAHGLAAAEGGAETASVDTGSGMPPEVMQAYTDVFRETLWVVPAVLVLGLVTVMFLERPKHMGAAPGAKRPPKPSGVDAKERDVPYIPPTTPGRTGHPNHLWNQ